MSGARAIEAMRRLAAATDLVAQVEGHELATAEEYGELLVELTRQCRRLDHEAHRLLRAFDSSGAATALGFRDAGQFCRARLRMSNQTARRRLRLARQLGHMPTIARHWAAGDLDAEHVALIGSARTDETAKLFAETEDWFVEKALELEFRALTTVIKRWKLRADPGTDEPERRERDRDAHVSETFEGTVVADATLDPIRGAVFKRVFDQIVDELFKADWAEAKERLGRDPIWDELRRTAAQRRADALVEMATRAEMCRTSKGKRPRPLLIVVSGLQALADGLAELWDETPISAKQLARILEQDPDIERYVYGSREEPIAYNERSRLYTGKLRRAIQVRDRFCTGEGCDLPADYCDVDHIEPVADGGRTTPTNGRVACNPDNRARPRRRFRNDPDP